MAKELQIREPEPDEARELVELSFDELAGLFDGIHQFHGGVAGRVFRYTGPAAAPVRTIHDRVAQTIYGGLGEATPGPGPATPRGGAPPPGWGGPGPSTPPPG